MVLLNSVAETKISLQIIQQWAIMHIQPPHDEQVAMTCVPPLWTRCIKTVLIWITLGAMWIQKHSRQVGSKDLRNLCQHFAVTFVTQLSHREASTGTLYSKVRTLQHLHCLRVLPDVFMNQPDDVFTSVMAGRSELKDLSRSSDSAMACCKVRHRRGRPHCAIWFKCYFQLHRLPRK